MTVQTYLQVLIKGIAQLIKSANS